MVQRMQIAFVVAGYNLPRIARDGEYRMKGIDEPTGENSR